MTRSPARPTRRIGSRRAALSALCAAAVTVAGFITAGAATAAVPGHLPWGHLNRVTVTHSRAKLTGAAADPDTTAPIKVTVSLDGRPQTAVTANRYNAAFGHHRPHYGPHHGYAVQLPIPDGTHRVCVVADNVARGHNVRLRCVTLTGHNDPVGAITGTTHTAAGVTVTGWALDPNTAAPAKVAVSVDGAPSVLATADRSTALPDRWASYGRKHGFAVTVPATRYPHTMCVTVVNIGPGSRTALGCRTAPVFITTPSAPRRLTTLATLRRIKLQWAAPADDGGDPVTGYRVSGSGIKPQTLPSTATSIAITGLTPATTYRLTVAAVNAIGTGTGATANVTTDGAPPSAPLNLSATAGTGGVTLHWAPPANNGGLPITGYRISRTGATAITTRASATSASITGLRPATGYTFSLAAVNEVGPGAAATATVTTAGSKPTAPRKLTASKTSTTVTLHWTKPADTGDGLPLTGYRITRRGAKAITKGRFASSVTVKGLKAAKQYSFGVVALNALGASPTARLTVKTAVPIPPQTTPAPVSTSHYLRNLTGVADHDVPLMRAMGARDAGYNPSGHRYLVLHDIGAQSGKGVVLSATARWISYPALVRALEAYIHGYAGRQKANAPLLLAIGTNNDGRVSYGSGSAWADNVIDPVRTYARRYRSVTVAGADDMEPGFLAGPIATRRWLAGYLSATGAKFVFNGSADGCPTGSRGRCNNGWSTSELHWLAGGAAPQRILSLPQIYNTDMPLQWRSISADGATKVHFAGPLTEWTACAQAHGCSSEPNVSAWRLLFNALASNKRTRMAALPYGTDLRIN